MTVINDETVEILYGKPATQPVQTETEKTEIAAGESALSEILYPKADESGSTGNKYALEEDSGSTENVLYGESERVTLSGETDLTVIGETPEQQQALSENLSAIASTAGASQGDIHDLVTHANKMLITGETPDPAVTMSSLYERYGTSLNGKLQDAQDLVASYPELHNWLESTGLGDDHIIISRIIQLAETNRSQLRLKTIRNRK